MHASRQPRGSSAQQTCQATRLMEGKRKGQRVVGQRCHTGQQQVREVSDHGLAARLSVVQTHFILCFLKYVRDLIF